MKLAAAYLLAVAAGVAKAADLGTEQTYTMTGDDYYSNPGYVSPTYETPYEHSLPGADFNQQVYEFAYDAETFDQEMYEHRVRLEAELLVALEALKAEMVVLRLKVTAIGRLASKPLLMLPPVP